jgi:hypothetical protein
VTKEVSVQEEVENLRREQLIIEDQLVAFDEENDKTKARKITLWADLLAREYTLLGNEWFLNQISKTISEKLRARGNKYWHHVSDFLPDKYKDPNYQWERGSDQQFSHAVKIAAKNQIEDLVSRIKQSREPDHELLRDTFEVLEKATDEVRKECDQHRVPLVNMNSWGEPIKGEEEEHTVSIIKPKPMVTIAYEEMVAYGKTVLDYAETLRQFPPELDVDVQFIARGARVMREFLQPSLDLKWSKSYGGWLKIEKDRLDYGKHAAAVKNYTTTNVCAMCSNLHKDVANKVEPTIVELVRDPKSDTGMKCPQCGCTAGLKRNMTREQVGDKSPIILKFAWKIANTWPMFQEAIFHHMQYIEKRCGYRKRDLSPVLSDRA